MYIIKLINTEEEIMKLKLNIDSKYSEKEVHIFADKVDDKINQIINICNKKEKFKLLSIKDEKYIPINIDEVIRFYSLDKKVYCQTLKDTLIVKEPIYKLEELYSDKLIKISRGELINPDFIDYLDLSLTGTITIFFINKEKTYSSRRFIKEIKRSLGI